MNASHDRLAQRLSRSVGNLQDPAAPLVVVDLDAFDANLTDMLRRAGDTPIRLASKSIRIPALIRRALAATGVVGVLSYNLREALWLVQEGITDDAVVAYPTVDSVAVGKLSTDAEARTRVTLMVDSLAHLDLIDTARSAVGLPAVPLRIAIDVDAGLRWRATHIGPKRSPLFDTTDVLALAREVLARGMILDGVMTYEGQVAGVPDDVPGQRAKSFVVRRLKGASINQLVHRRALIANALAEVAPLRFWNGGGSGSIESTVADPVVTEVAAGSGLLVPTLFDHYQSFRPRPAAYFGVRVVRRPGPGVATVAGGGFIASGPAGKDRSPTPWAPGGLRLTGLEGAGEVQTPLVGPGADALRVGDLVWFRHAKAGELAEHANRVHLLRGDDIVDTVPSYRGLGRAW